MVPFHPAPAVVVSLPPIGRGRHIDFLPRRVTDIGDVEIAGLAVEREAPRIAESPHPRRRRKTGVGHEGIVAGGDKARGTVHVYPMDLGVHRLMPLAILERIAAAAAVPKRHIQHPIGTELQLPPVMIREGEARPRDRMGHGENRVCRIGIRTVRVRRAEVAHVTVQIREEDEELVVRGVLRMKRHAEQATLDGRVDLAAQVEKRRRHNRVVADDPDGAAALGHEQACRIRYRRRQIRRPEECPDRLEHRCAGGRGRRRRWRNRGRIAARGEHAHQGKQILHPSTTSTPS